MEYELMTKSWMFEDVEAFKRGNKKYDERFIKDRKKFIENEASLLKLVLNVSNLYEYKIKYEKGNLRVILEKQRNFREKF